MTVCLFVCLIVCCPAPPALSVTFHSASDSLVCLLVWLIDCDELEARIYMDRFCDLEKYAGSI